MIRVAIICDFPEERWISMDLVAEMLHERLAEEFRAEIDAVMIRPAMKMRLSPLARRSRAAFNADRIVNRFRDYPRAVRGIRDSFDIFHIIDHSYAHLAHELPPERTIVTCHDIDAFRCVVEPWRERRSAAFRALTRRILSGMRRAARVNCISAATRDDLLRYRLAAEERTAVIHNGVHPVFGPRSDANSAAALSRMIGEPRAGVHEIVHVGSAIPRKRIDVLLRAFAALHAQRPDVRLIKAGAALTREQAELARKLNITEAIVVLPMLERAVLAELYRRAAIVMIPSEAEGFGLPAVEAMACGTPVVATDIAAFREIAGGAATLCALGDIGEWSARAAELLRERESRPDSWRARQHRCVRHASRFSWSANAAANVREYRAMLAEHPHTRESRDTVPNFASI